MRAVVFDFFGTLTDPAAESERRAAFGDTAAALGVPAEVFWARMGSTFTARATGRYGGTAATLRAIARECGADPDDNQLDLAVRVQHDGAGRVRRPRTGVLDLLGELRIRGFRLALLSDCASELCERWDDTPYAPYLDATVFSWQEGCRKPDPRLYATAAARLGVPADGCWFVGDGGSREHSGALAAGMRPVLVTNALVPSSAGHRDDPDPVRPEHVVDDPAELPALLGWPTSGVHAGRQPDPVG
ncbi:HAD family hydrolase [Micromonospora sp. NBC_01796]|uniref:HAD family hydrolase n=1 Tax=Micromonospora sp. NBC_01796 TaxID=2975987 RepID=UPI002DD9221B|nr:HAD family hydrolase [Micromonospora sp. NBC_01796]WSA85467.1 HAD family hydrolase [Micromonospora sp. NBC_01796]